MFPEMSYEELVQKVADREAVVLEAIGLAEGLVFRRGSVVSREQHDYHTRIVLRLEDFGGVTIETESGQTDFGGNSVMILIAGHQVFSARWQTDPSKAVVWCHSDPEEWLTTLRDVVARQDEIATAQKLVAEASHAAVQASLDVVKNREELEARAFLLGLRP